jgi:hypothetical protein
LGQSYAKNLNGETDGENSRIVVVERRANICFLLADQPKGN